MITPSYSVTATERVLPKLALDFTTASLDARVTFTRTTDATHPATYVNSSGYVTSATDNQPRFDYDPVALTCKGLLIEESRTNSCKYSEDFTNGWAFTRSTYSSNAATSPANTLTGDKLIEDSTASNSHFCLTAFVTSSSGTWTFTTYVKAAEDTYAFVGISDLATGGAERRINLSTGVVDATNVGAAGSWTAISATSSNAGNGWWKISVTATQGAGTSIAGIIYTGNSSGARVYSGNGTNGIYVWGSQLEAGAFATSYIPTTSAALTRNADVATMTGTNFSSWYNQAAGSFMAQAIVPQLGRAGRILGVDSGTTANLFVIGTAATNQVSSDSVVASVYSGGAYSTTTISANTSFKMCSSYSNTTSEATALNGGGIAGASFSVGVTMNEMYLGTQVGPSSFLNGTIAKISYWPQKLTLNEVTAFSK